jgi:hypothetical protein
MPNAIKASVASVIDSNFDTSLHDTDGSDTDSLPCFRFALIVLFFGTPVEEDVTPKQRAMATRGVSPSNSKRQTLQM